MTLKVPEEVWLFGKGPSYDAVDFWSLGSFRVAINDMAFHVPAINMIFANDTNMQDRLLKEFQPLKYITVNPIIVTRNNRLRFPFHLQHEANGHGTAGYAVNVLSDLGARKFHMIGFDSYYGDHSYSKIFKGKPQEGRIYDGIIKYLKRIAEEKKLDLIFYGKDDKNES